MQDRETKMDTDTAEKVAIREPIENWVLWRDAGDWERFRTVTGESVQA
jgi:hypothetical protein